MAEKLYTKFAFVESIHNIIWENTYPAMIRDLFSGFCNSHKNLIGDTNTDERCISKSIFRKYPPIGFQTTLVDL